MRLSKKHIERITIAIILLMWAGVIIESLGNNTIDLHEYVEESGELTWLLLSFTVFISLAQKLFVIWMPKLMILSRILPSRKWTGIFAFIIGASHGLAEAAKRGGISIESITSSWFSTHHAAIFGTISVLIMLPLFLTSTRWAIKKMGSKKWKWLHRLTHVAFIFAGLHTALIYFFENGGVEWDPVGLMAVYAVGYGYLSYKRKKKMKEKVLHKNNT